MRARTTIATITLALVACRHRVASPPAPTAVRPADEPCWWSVWRTALPLDSVARGFAAAYAAAGLSGATVERRADTVRVHAGPARLDGPRGGATYDARMVAYRRGDSTLFRPYLTLVVPPGGLTPPYDSVNPGGLMIGFCQDVLHAAALHATAPREPNGEESLAVWAGRP